MLRQTFLFIRGVGPCTEQKIWNSGVRQWSDLERCPVAGAWKTRAQAALARAEDALSSRDAQYFQSILPSRELWRMIPEFAGQAAYLDIETTGLDPRRNPITMIGLYSDQGFQTFVRNENMDQFARAIQQYRLIVTFNGKLFDVPYIERSLGVPMPMAHIDLRFALASAGHRGGLKAIQRRFGLDRPEQVAGVDGLVAVWLWQRWERTGNRIYRDVLELYNLEDVAVLPVLLAHAYNLHLQTTPFPQLAILPDEPPLPPVQVDPSLACAVMEEYRAASGALVT